MTWNDPIVEEVRKARAKIAAEHGNDIDSIGRYYQQEQQQESRKPVILPPRRPIVKRAIGQS